ncbi:glycosyltransferase family 4 protein [Georgenia sp. EYE_87]|uniref:glycosyltransferase n=1 Tax=Georgenia sp. EYE_87 TaxID=2853448 RepID=UPI0020067A6A|nr:glycosyltransferase family 4 protein [Georgenia sp. EYE_87]MCK6210816.1 glycosyltransferase family 4 protein [Georgenia sp. EYE_87]
MPTMLGARDAHLKGLIHNSKTDIVLISALSQAPYSGLSSARLWLDFMDVWSDVARREGHVRRGAARLSARLQAAYLAQHEQRYASRAHIVTTTGWSDHKLLRSRGIDNLWIPSTLPDDEFQAVNRRHGGGAKVAGFIGNFEYWPNVDAYRVLVDSWLPRLRSEGWSVLVAGRHSHVLGEPPPGITLLGEVPSVADFYREVSVTLAPIRLGGGMKVKVLESLAKGVPVIGTDFAFDGFSPELRGKLLACDVTRPDFHSLDGIEPFSPLDPVLEPYRLSAVTKKLASVLA